MTPSSGVRCCCAFFFVAFSFCASSCFDPARPDDVVLGCADDDDCPPEQSKCTGVEGLDGRRCRAAEDESVPAVLSAVADPARGNADTLFRVTVDADKNLASCDGRAPGFLLVGADVLADAHRCLLSFDAQEEAEARAVVVDLVPSSAGPPSTCKPSRCSARTSRRRPCSRPRPITCSPRATPCSSR